MTALALRNLALAAWILAGLASLAMFCYHAHRSGEFDLRHFGLARWLFLIGICLLTGPWMLMDKEARS